MYKALEDLYREPDSDYRWNIEWGIIVSFFVKNGKNRGYRIKNHKKVEQI